MPEGSREGILRGMYPLRESEARGPRVQLLGSGTILREAEAAAAMLAEDWDVAADVWSVTSWSELRRDGLAAERWNLLHPTEPQRKSHVETLLEERSGPVVGVSDYMKTVADQIRPFVPGRYRVLGTDGFGRSDVRERLRHFFEVNRASIALAALKSLSDDGQLDPATVEKAIERYKIDPEKPDPTTV
jgi:pyruvate dehydrogenase E1 component